MLNTSDRPTENNSWEGTSAYGWFVTALVLFISFYDLDLVVPDAPFQLDFNFTGFLIAAAILLNQSRYFRITENHLDIDGAFNAADIAFDTITQFKIRHIFIIGYVLTIEYQGKASSQKQRIIFLNHLKNHKAFTQELVSKLPSTAQQTIPTKYLS